MVFFNKGGFMKKLIWVLVLGLSPACGTDQTKVPKNQTADTSDQGTTSSDLTSTTNPFVVNGYVSPINISVNGTQYKDSEDFYTQEVARLTNEVHQKYPGYSLYFDATVGLQDFKEGLTVFLVASGDTGMAGESSVDSNGKFTFNLPADVDKTALYTLRATKRIGLRLVKAASTDTTATTTSSTDSSTAGDTISWCYNLFAENDQLSLSNKSFILRTFTTTITSYQCETDSQQQINVPDSPYNYVVDAFTSATKYNGYGPLPANNTPAVTPAPTPTTTTTTATPALD